MKTPRTILTAIAALTLLPSLLSAGELIHNGDFADKLSGWWLGTHGSAVANTSFESTDMDGKNAVEIEVLEAGQEAWQVQFAQRGFSVAAGKTYTLTFYAKAEPDLYNVVAAISQASGTYALLASKESLVFTPDWKMFEFKLTPQVDEPDARLIFSNLGSQPGKIWFAQVSLVESD